MVDSIINRGVAEEYARKLLREAIRDGAQEVRVSRDAHGVTLQIRKDKEIYNYPSPPGAAQEILFDVVKAMVGLVGNADEARMMLAEGKEEIGLMARLHRKGDAGTVVISIPEDASTGGGSPLPDLGM
ncbi:MAG TPA: hypothetical protein PLO37_18825 [Candidatus Hydrogenedentes bacterium]|nr:hypothetical protein [Candidatus Hydrogenedentota bacterium]HPG68905.1 hypothetical protein [Candidatus Hydrogenedentota bacterium]